MSESAAGYSRAQRTRFQKALAAWFSVAARDLPWRKSRELYRIWISEIMLQQTQVATVIAYFNRFTAAFPTAAELAAAPEADVLRLWEGLGYYRRARQLHAAAKKIVTEYGGEFPRTFDAVRALPGVGRYTAGAILSIGLDLPLPILEANTVRLFSRLAGFQGDPHSTVGQAFLWKFAEEILPAEDIGLFNQALMELGSLICKPREPACGECPVAAFCAAKKLGLQAEIPRPKKKPVIEDVTEAAVVIRRGKSILIRRRKAKERWAGMWDFPRFEVAAENEAALAAEVADNVQSQMKIAIDNVTPLATIKHGVTRFRITLRCFTAAYGRGKIAGDEETLWLDPNALEEYPLSVSGRKIARLLVRPAAQSQP